VGVFKNIRHGVAVTVCGVAMSIGLATAVQASTAPAATAANPTKQNGIVHSCTTGRTAYVYTNDGGLEWEYDGMTEGTPASQYGVVYSYNTGEHANVLSGTGGLYWNYFANSGPPFCSIP
jgi:hypothetical protein